MKSVRNRNRSTKYRDFERDVDLVSHDQEDVLNEELFSTKRRFWEERETANEVADQRALDEMTYEED